MTVCKPDDPRLAAVSLVLVSAEGCTIGPSGASLTSRLQALVAERASGDFPAPPVKDAVRAMLRAGGFKPSGRQKPASEYLAQAAREGRFPFINNAVDVNNYLSLDCGLPVSLLDAAVVGPAIQLRIAAAGESYVFNSNGHQMDLAGLVCICKDDGRPLGNPVKDSMYAKLSADSRDLVGFMFAPASLYSIQALSELGQRFASLLAAECGAKASAVTVLV
ncbi:MAG: hypothetical protein A2087_03430 [Spirochaetes bacterium GWD1_61_31]|nr:MAG: hypothetical protein A2Y37_11190 [Spirochaetes bacterium GWB1_60_80]OHD35341.1 MAG: hypothetical protein A2004_00425 [Spirochaetes bacterium GWC1_61_12]OHD36110.1 MAG: hypothetical protein A2087_03430 [Spirochaetes bacterium GWD1_61_31]OHD44997.1 MAG: hypothetical protein A2Y35_13235 [Spirochaetes bacterium GWE1_60_18]OHD60106.1 MAG: hypothetical protein A2Y32_11345 [Spirochaetes bacterium GWF1_60_12]